MATIFELEQAAASAQAQLYNAQQTGDPDAIAQAQANVTYNQANFASAYNGAVVTPEQAQTLQASLGKAVSVTADGQGGYVVAAAPPPPPPPAPPVQKPQPVTLPTTSAPVSALPSTAPQSSLKPRLDIGSGFTDAGSYCAVYPEDLFCQTYLGLGTLVGLIAPTVVNETVVIQETGLLAMDVQNLIDNGLDGLWAAVVTGVDDVLVGIVKGIQVAITELGNALKAAYAWLSRLAGMILSLLKTVIEDILKGVVQAVQDLEQAVKDIYGNVLKPLAAVMQNVRNALLDIWKKFFVPMLIVLQDIRRVLTILSLFHLKFAQKLDNAIADLERRITTPLFYLLGYVNAVSNWINLIMAANYLLQKPTFLNSLNAYLGEALNLQFNGMNKPIDPAALAAAQASGVYPTSAQSRADAQQFISSGTGAFEPIVAQQQQRLQQMLAGNF